MASEELEAFETEILQSDSLAEALYSELSMDAVRAKIADAGDIRERTRRGWDRRSIVAAAAIIAILGLLGVRDRLPTPADDLVRSGSSGPKLVIQSDSRVTWPRIEGASHYRVEVSDPHGVSLRTWVVAETTSHLDSTGLEQAASLTVTPLTPDGIELPTLPIVTLTRR